MLRWALKAVIPFKNRIHLIISNFVIKNSRQFIFFLVLNLSFPFFSCCLSFLRTLYWNSEFSFFQNALLLLKVIVYQILRYIIAVHSEPESLVAVSYQLISSIKRNSPEVSGSRKKSPGKKP